jgi:hypothetical protein
MRCTAQSRSFVAEPKQPLQKELLTIDADSGRGDFTFSAQILMHRLSS